MQDYLQGVNQQSTHGCCVPGSPVKKMLFPRGSTEVTHYSTYNKIFIRDQDGLFTVAPHLLHSSHHTVLLSG